MVKNTCQTAKTIVVGTCGCREFVYLGVLMDVFTRSIRCWHLSRNLDQVLTLAALKRLFWWPCPEP